MGQAINAVTGTRLWAFVFPLPGTILTFWNDFDFAFAVGLRSCRQCHSVAVVQGLVHFSAHPQVMQQHRQLSCRSHDRSLLSVSSATLRQFQSPASEVTIDTKRPQNVLRSLPQQSADKDRGLLSRDGVYPKAEELIYGKLWHGTGIRQRWWSVGALMERGLLSRQLERIESSYFFGSVFP